MTKTRGLLTARARSPLSACSPPVRRRQTLCPGASCHRASLWSGSTTAPSTRGTLTRCAASRDASSRSRTRRREKSARSRRLRTREPGWMRAPISSGATARVNTAAAAAHGSDRGSAPVRLCEGLRHSVDSNGSRPGRRHSRRLREPETTVVSDRSPRPTANGLRPSSDRRVRRRRWDRAQVPGGSTAMLRRRQPARRRQPPAPRLRLGRRDRARRRDGERLVPRVQHPARRSRHPQLVGSRTRGERGGKPSARARDLRTATALQRTRKDPSSASTTVTVPTPTTTSSPASSSPSRRATGATTMPDPRGPGEAPIPPETYNLAPSFPSSISPSVLSVGGTTLKAGGGGTARGGYTEDVVGSGNDGRSRDAASSSPSPPSKMPSTWGPARCARTSTVAAPGDQGVSMYGNGWGARVAGTSCASPFVAGLLTRLRPPRRSDSGQRVLLYEHGSAFYGHHVRATTTRRTSAPTSVMCNAGVRLGRPNGMGLAERCRAPRPDPRRGRRDDVGPIVGRRRDRLRP